MAVGRKHKIKSTRNWMKPTYKEEIEKKIEICVRHACESHMYAPTNRDFKNNKTTRGTAKYNDMETSGTHKINIWADIPIGPHETSYIGSN